jgi:hypothetical protein
VLVHESVTTQLVRLAFTPQEDSPLLKELGFISYMLTGYMCFHSCWVNWLKKKLCYELNNHHFFFRKAQGQIFIRIKITL